MAEFLSVLFKSPIRNTTTSKLVVDGNVVDDRSKLLDVDTILPPKCSINSSLLWIPFDSMNVLILFSICRIEYVWSNRTYSADGW